MGIMSVRLKLFSGTSAELQWTTQKKKIYEHVDKLHRSVDKLTSHHPYSGCMCRTETSCCFIVSQNTSLTGQSSEHVTLMRAASTTCPSQGEGSSLAVQKSRKLNASCKVTTVLHFGILVSLKLTQMIVSLPAGASGRPRCCRRSRPRRSSSERAQATSLWWCAVMGAASGNVVV